MGKKRKHVSISSSSSSESESSYGDLSRSSDNVGDELSGGESLSDHEQQFDAPPVHEQGSAGKSNSRTDYWSYTLNHPTSDDILRLKALHTDGRNRVVYHVFQEEIAPETGTPHIQVLSQFYSVV